MFVLYCTSTSSSSTLSWLQYTEERAAFTLSLHPHPQAINSRARSPHLIKTIVTSHRWQVADPKLQDATWGKTGSRRSCVTGHQLQQAERHLVLTVLKMALATGGMLRRKSMK